MRTTASKKVRVMARLITALANKSWVSRKDLQEIASPSYLSEILTELLDEGKVRVRGARGNYFYQATPKLGNSVDLGQLPRSTLSSAPLPKGERPRLVEVGLRPIDEFLDPQAMWMEAAPVYFRIDAFTAEKLRESMEPPSRRDRAKQYSISTESFSLTLASRGSCKLYMKTRNWPDSLRGFMIGSGLSVQSSERVMGIIHSQLPDKLQRFEMPVLDTSLKRRKVDFVVRTKLGNSRIETNINYSTDIDLEVLGNTDLVDPWLRTLAGGQHNMVATIAALEERIKELAQKINELQREKDDKRRRDDSEGSMYV